MLPAASGNGSFQPRSASNSGLRHGCTRGFASITPTTRGVAQVGARCAAWLADPSYRRSTPEPFHRHYSGSNQLQGVAATFHIATLAGDDVSNIDRVALRPRSPLRRELPPTAHLRYEAGRQTGLDRRAARDPVVTSRHALTGTVQRPVVNGVGVQRVPVRLKLGGPVLYRPRHSVRCGVDLKRSARFQAREE